MPPIWVAAWRQPEAQESGVPEDGERRSASARRRASSVLGRHAVALRAGRHRARRVRAGSPRSTNSASRRSSRASLQEDVTTAALAAQTDVRAEPVDQPGVAAARVGRRRRTTSPSEQRKDWSGRASAGQGIKGAGDRGPGRASRSVAGSSRRSIGRDGDDDVRLRGGQLRDDAAGAGQRTGQLVRCADRFEVERVAEVGPPIEARGAGRVRPRRRPGRSRTPADGDGLGAGVAQLVDQVLQTRAVDRPADRDRHARARRPDPGRRRPGRAEVGAHLVDRRLTACLVLGQRRELALERSRSRAGAGRSAAFRLATRTVRSCDESWASPAPPAWARSWTTTSRPSTKATAAIVSWLRRTCIAVSPAGSRLDPGRATVRPAAASSAG